MTAQCGTAHRNGNPADDSDATVQMPQPESGGFKPEETPEEFDPERTLVQEDHTLVQENWDTDTLVLEPLKK